MPVPFLSPLEKSRRWMKLLSAVLLVILVIGAAYIIVSTREDHIAPAVCYALFPASANGPVQLSDKPKMEGNGTAVQLHWNVAQRAWEGTYGIDYYSYVPPTASATPEIDAGDKYGGGGTFAATGSCPVP